MIQKFLSYCCQTIAICFVRTWKVFPFFFLQSWTVGKSWSRFWGNPMWAQQCCNMRSSVFPFFEHSLRPAWPFRIGWREHLPESIRTCLVDRSFKRDARPVMQKGRIAIPRDFWTRHWAGNPERGNDQRTLKSSTMSLMAWWSDNSFLLVDVSWDGTTFIIFIAERFLFKGQAAAKITQVRIDDWPVFKSCGFSSRPR